MKKKLNAHENRKQFGSWAKKNLTIPDEKVFCEGATIARHHVKRKIITRNLIDYKCGLCGIDPVLSLIHI